MVSFKWLVVAGLALGTIGCGSGRVNKLEEQMQTMQMQMDSLSSKMDKLTTMQSNLQKLESLTDEQKRRLEGIRSAIISILRASNEALQNSISTLEAQ